MRRFKMFILYFLIIAIVGCNNEEKLKDESLNFKNIKVEINDSGNLHIIEVVTDSRKNESKYFSFYEGNRLRAESTICNGKICGDEIVYDSITGKKVYFRNFVQQEGRTMRNEVIKFDTNGTIDIKESKYLTVTTSKEIVNPNEKFELKVKLNGSAFSKYKTLTKKLVIAEMDDSYKILNRYSIIVVSMEDGEANVELQLNKLGNNEIRGMVLEKAVLSDTTDSINPIYFTIPIYVRSNKSVSHINLIRDYNFYDSLFGRW